MIKTSIGQQERKNCVTALVLLARGLKPILSPYTHFWFRIVEHSVVVLTPSTGTRVLIMEGPII